MIPQCSPEDGQCPCKPGVTGQYCEACEPTHFNFGPAGCEDCQCRPDGSLNNTPKCDPVTANCECKQNVEGKIPTTWKWKWFNYREWYNCVTYINESWLSN